MRILLLLLAALGGYFLLRHLYRESGVKIYQIILGIVAITLIALVILGKAHWLMAVAGGLLAIFGKAFLVGFRFLPLFRFAYQAYVGTKQHIKFRSRWIEITVQRASGEIEGMVLRGPLRGRALSSLGPKSCRNWNGPARKTSGLPHCCEPTCNMLTLPGKPMKAALPRAMPLTRARCP